MTWPRTLLTVAVPPLSVYVRHGVGRAFWLSVLLTALFYLPGVAHAFWVLKRPSGAAGGTRPADAKRRTAAGRS